ncbi:MAG: DUF4157 domain-containing protein [Leptolyngbya sp. RL_3_1]|nr:DUF4157 domain-containing protein [Leptolyngbya sp. RL_3_1]
MIAHELTHVVQQNAGAVARSETESLQAKLVTDVTSVQRQNSHAVADNRTGLPNSLKTGLEQLGAVDLSGVQVHYNSSEPAQMNALAYTQGQDIHIGPGQEQHLPHEGWHVVQQMQGRVKPTVQAKLPINDDHRLEREADLMGAKAAALQQSVPLAAPAHLNPAVADTSQAQHGAKGTVANAPIQMVKPASKAEALKIPPLCKSKVKKAAIANEVSTVAERLSSNSLMRVKMPLS